MQLIEFAKLRQGLFCAAAPTAARSANGKLNRNREHTDDEKQRAPRRDVEEFRDEHFQPNETEHEREPGSQINEAIDDVREGLYALVSEGLLTWHGEAVVHLSVDQMKRLSRFYI